MTQAIRTSDLDLSSGGSGGGSGGTGVAGPTLTDYVGKWTMDTVDTTSTTVTDTGTGGYNMTLVNAPTINIGGQKSQAVNIDKFQQQYGWISKTATAALTSFSICVWFRTSYTSQASVIIEHFHLLDGVGIQLSNTGIVSASHGDGTVVLPITSTVTGTNDGDWHQAVYTYDLGTTTSNLYVDGILQGTRADITGTGWPTGTELGVGTLLGSFPTYYGDIDEIKIFDYALTGVQVEDIHIQDGATIALIPPVDYTGYYTMDTANISGSNIVDLGSKSLNLTMLNQPVTGGGGQVNESIYFDLASSTYATVPNAMLYNEVDMGIGLWFKSFATTSQTLASTYSLESAGTLQYGMQIVLTNAGALTGYVAGGTGLIVGTDIDLLTSDTVGLNDGSWHYVFLAYDSTTTTMCLYVDGILEKTDATVAALAHHSSRALYFGQDPAGSPSLVGSLDSIKIFDYSPNSQEVLALYQFDGGV